MQIRSLLGIVAMLGLLYVFSSNRKAIKWRLVMMGMGLQLCLGFIFLKWDRGNLFLRGVGDWFKELLEVAAAGATFIFGSIGPPAPLPPGAEAAASAGPSLGFIFATWVLPTLIFFSSLMAVLYHLGVMQFVVRKMARLMAILMGTSGSESLSACSNIFVGQTEAPLMVKPYIGRMTRSEIHAIMVGGYCTIAGGVFALYVGFGVEPGHLMVASVMAVPAGLVCSKILMPETEESETMGKVVDLAKSEAGGVVEAASNGAIDGLQLALNVGGMLIAFLGLVAVANWMLGGIELPWSSTGIDGESTKLSIELILGYVFYPIAYALGADPSETMYLSELLGKKIVLTELVAYQEMKSMVEAGLIGERTKLIASFALCGFANLGSVAIQIGGLGAMAPERRGEIAKLAVKAMWCGALVTCMTAAMAGLLS
ncbi:MAG: CNT family concentrative nucleoside transporter [Pseudohongiellaceae bacterium]|jgi:CNT family concentrative nucleoside transporter